MDTNYANAGGGGTAGGGGVGAGTGLTARYSASYYKEPAASCQRSISYNAYEPYGGSGTGGGRPSSAYPYDAEAEFKERTGMGKSKSSHLTMAPLSGAKLQQHSYNLTNNCYGAYGQSVGAMATESANYYAYAYNQHHPYPQQQPQQSYPQQSQLEQQYKYNMTAKSADPQQQQQQTHQQHQQQHQQSAVNGMKMSTPEYGYAPYRHLQHPYYHPHYHHALAQKGGVGLMKTMPDANGMPYASSKMVHSTGMGGARVHQYQTNYPYHPTHGYPAAVSAGHHTYQSQSVCDDSRWMWNGGGGGDYQSSCRSAYPAYVNSSVAKQGAMWPTMPMQYPNSMSAGYPTAAAAVTNQSCCASTPSAGSYYSQQYVKHQMQSSAISYDGATNDLYSSSQVNSAAAPAKVYTDLSAQPQESSYQAMNASSYHQPGSCSASPALDYNHRYLQQHHQQQQQTPLPTSSTSATSAFSHHYYHNLHPYAHQAYAAADSQESLYNQQQGDTKLGATTKSQSLRDFLTSWNEDEDECADRTMISTDAPFMEPMHLSADHYPTQAQEQQHNGAKPSPVMENHLQFKGSFTTRPKIHVGITVDSTVEPDQYINLPDIIIDIEKSNKDVVSLPEDILVTTIPKVERDEAVTIKEEKPDEPNPTPATEQPPEVKRKFRRKFLRRRRLSRKQKLRLIQRNQRMSRLGRSKSQRPANQRAKKLLLATQPPRDPFNPQSLKCLCVSLINSDKFRHRILGQSEIESLINLTTDPEVKIDVPAVSITTPNTSADADADADATSTFPASDIPKLSDLCKNALNSSFDRDVLVINLDEILDSDSLFVVQCDINENILENLVGQQQLHEADQASADDPDDADDANNITHDDLVEILNDNNNNYDSSTGRGNYIPTAAVTTIATAATATATATAEKAANSTIKKRKRCCSLTEVSNLPLDSAVELNNSNSTNPTNSPSPPPPPNSPSSRSCPPALFAGDSPPSPLIEQNCPTQQITVGHEQLHEMLLLSGIVHAALQTDDQPRDNSNDTATQITHTPPPPPPSPPPPPLADDTELLMLVSAAPTPSTIHHEEIVPDNLKKFQNEKFLKYLHAKYVQGNLSEFYHANRVIKKYKKRIIKKILNIVR